MTPSEQCKLSGLKSLSQLAALSGIPRRTLIDWHKFNQTKFMVAIDAALWRLIDMKPIDWTKISAKDRIELIISSHLERHGQTPFELRISKKLIADLWLSDELERGTIISAQFSYRNVNLYPI